MVPPGWFRLTRAAGFASACVVLAQGGHDLMASRPAPIWAGWAALAGVGTVGYFLADRRRSLWWLLLAVEVVQAFLHLWFAWATPETAPVRLDMVMRDGVHQAAGTPMAHADGVSPGMLGAHLLAGLLVAVWLYAGERALWRVPGVIAKLLLGGGARALLLLVHGGPAPDLPGRLARRRRDIDEPPPVVAALRHTLMRRGPPRARVLAVG